ncbi:MAG: hypothetical protein ACKVPJ_13050 [Chitinophagales bacterium]
MKFYTIILLLFAACTIFSCAQSAKCDCLTTVRNSSDGSIISEEQNLYQSAGNDPTCNDFEDEVIEDSTTTTIECTEL